MTTAYIFDGEDMSAAHRAESLKKTAASVINNMLSTHYFTYFYDGKQPIRYKRVMRGTMTKSKGKARLRFELVLAKPYPLNNKTLKFLIFDPTYYIDMSWRKPPQDITFSAALKPFCHYKIIEPHPTPAQVSYAMSIPIDADPDNHLGQLFTQSMLLTCYNPESGL